MRVNWQLWRSRVTKETCDQIISSIPRTEDATTFGGENSHRSSKIHFIEHDTPDYSLAMQMLWFFVNEANSKVFGFNIYQKADFQYTEYLASEDGHYKMHHDIDWNRDDGFDRKLSITVQLSDPQDYDGGDFLFNEVENLPQGYKEQGSVLVFPSYLTHQVTPVTRGIRRSLVAWFEGPRWQ